MKTFFAFLFLVIFPIGTSAQDTITNYWDKYNHKIKQRFSERITQHVIVDSNRVYWRFFITGSKQVRMEGYYQPKFGTVNPIEVNETYLPEIKNYVQEGVWTWWYKNGKMEKHGNFQKGKKDGLWQSWYRNGNLKNEVEYRKGKQHGYNKSYFENGNLKSSTNYHLGKMDSTFITYYENGSKMGVLKFKNGLLDGRIIEWYENGNKQSEIYYKNGVKDGIFSSWYENAKLAAKGKYKNNEENGLWTYWHENGTVKMSGVFDDGMKEGIWKVWYTNEQIKEETFYTYNIRLGTAIEYYENGQKKAEGNYNRNNKEGMWLWWHADGALKQKGEFTSTGRRTGDWYATYKNGSQDYTGTYLGTEKNGEWKYFFSNGQLSALEIYEKGKLLSEKFWSEDGALMKRATNINQIPLYLEGEDALFRHLNNSIRYPLIAKLERMEGTVYVSAEIDRMGDIVEVRVIKSVHELLDNEAVCVVETLGKFIPGKKHNRIDNVTIRIPITFEL